MKTFEVEEGTDKYGCTIFRVISKVPYKRGYMEDVEFKSYDKGETNSKCRFLKAINKIA